MEGRDTLDRLTDIAADDVLPFAHRVSEEVRRRTDDAMLAWLGDDFEQRLDQVREHYERRGGDAFGFDPDTAKYALMVAAFFHRAYFRTTVNDIDKVPEGRALLICNHSGQIPIDGMILCTSLFLDRDPPRVVRAMVEKWAPRLPFIGNFFSRCGQVVGVPDNCRRLLSMDETVLVFPEGVRGITKPFAKRYQLERFGTGFMRLAIETQTPIVPVGLVGAEEQYVNLGNAKRISQLLNFPAMPMIPQIFLPGGAMPLPTHYHLYFGDPIQFAGDPDDDDAIVEDKVTVVRDAIADLLDRGLRERKGVFR